MHITVFDMFKKTVLLQIENDQKSKKMFPPLIQGLTGGRKWLISWRAGLAKLVSLIRVPF